MNWKPRWWLTGHFRLNYRCKSAPPPFGTLYASASLSTLFAALSLQAWEPLPVEDDLRLFMPGSQPGTVQLDTASSCQTCHGDYEPTSEPFHTWQGSMMAQAARDPLWLAALTVANQDSIWALGNPNAGDLCLRCHTPTGWLGDRSDPVNGTALDASAGDFDGVTCDACHSQVDPFLTLGQEPALPPETDTMAIAEAAKTRPEDESVLSALTLFDGGPFFDTDTGLPVHYLSGAITEYSEATGGQYIMDPEPVRRGPRYDARRMHDWYYSRFHRSGQMCSTCHDVSNPALAVVTLGSEVPQQQASASYFHIERTWSEFALSAYGTPGGAPTAPALQESGIAHAASCQDCHMPAVRGRAAKFQSTYREDLRLHDHAGGNAWMSGILARVDPQGPVHDPTLEALLSGTTYPGAQIQTDGLTGAGEALLDGQQRAQINLQRAARLEWVRQDAATLVLRIVNQTGHKLISGFPEGRRMWLHAQFYDTAGQLLTEINPYTPLITQPGTDDTLDYVSGGHLDVTRDDLVYEVQLSSSLTGEEKTFHMVLATGRTKDNRIPPRGFDLTGANARLVEPYANGEARPDYFTAAECAGGYDEVTLSLPDRAAAWTVALYYQTTSKDYVEFLRDEIRGTATTLASPTPSGEPEAYIVQSDPFFATLKDWGEAIWQLWLRTDGSPPVRMTSLVSPPQLQEGVWTEPGFAVSALAAPGSRCQLQSRASLKEGVWSNIGEPQLATDAQVTWVDAEAASHNTRFYRVVAD